MQIVVLGAGPAGLEAASHALKLGHAVSIVDPEGLGGNGLRHSLLPSKTLIQAADVFRSGNQWSKTPFGMDWTRFMAWQQQLIEEGVRRARKKVEGAQVILDTGRFEDPHTLIAEQTGQRLFADVVIVATGSRQKLLEGMRPDGERVLLPRVFHTLTRLPEELAILGAGATGLEAASLFARFGVYVHLYADTLLPTFADEISGRVVAGLRQDGVEIHRDRRIKAIGEDSTGGVQIHWTSSLGSGQDVRPRVLLALGRESVFDRKGLEAMGFALDAAGFFRVDGNGMTNIPGVYAVGDASGEPLLANKAWSQGWRAVRQALGQGLKFPPGPPVHAIYCRPEIAWVGETSSHRYEAALDSPWLYQPLLEETSSPYLALYTDEGGRLVGGEAVGGGASEAMSTLGLAIQGELTLESLQTFQPASPTSAEWLAEIARESAPLST